MTKPFVNATAVTAAAARGSGADGHKRINPYTEPGPSATKLQHIKDEVAYWALRTFMRSLKLICTVADSISLHPQDEDR
jgi:hypothetical protein